MYANAGARAYPASASHRRCVVDKVKRLEAANFEKAEAAVRWEDSANQADETGRASDQARAAKDNRELDAADRKIKNIEAER
jgi:hypothetical protein